MGMEVGVEMEDHSGGGDRVNPRVVEGFGASTLKGAVEQNYP